MKINSQVSLPDEALHYHLLAFGKTRSGKTYTLKGFIEKLAALRRRLCIVDPTGVYWGLKYPGEGPHARGFPFVIFGGRHADVPINDKAAIPLAKLISEHNVPSIIDTQTMSVAERTRFFTKFSDELFRLSDPSRPLHLIIDEAHLFAPKSLPARSRSDGDDDKANPAQMLHNTVALATGGGSQGIRLMVASQRPAKLHNDIASQCETLIAMRVLHPTDRQAVEDWVKGQGDPVKAKEVLDSLAKLERGEGWLWYPEGDILVKTKFPQILSYDSSRTPDDKGAVPPPAGMADIDLSGVKAAMQEAIKEAQENDPKALKAEIKLLKIAAGKKAPPAPAPKIVNSVVVDRAAERLLRDEIRELKQLVEVLMKFVINVEAKKFAETDVEQLKAAVTAAVEKCTGQIQAHLEGRNKELARLKSEAAALIEKVNAIKARKPGTVTIDVTVSKADPSAPFSVSMFKPPTTHHSASPRTSGDAGDLGRGERLVLIAIAQYGDGGVTREQLSVLTGYKRRSRDTYLQRLQAAGLCEAKNGDIVATPEGIASLGDSYEPMPTGEELRQYWLNRLGGGEQVILKMLMESHPADMDRDEITTAKNYARRSRDTYLQRLTARKLVVVTVPGRVKASDQLFS